MSTRAPQCIAFLLLALLPATCLSAEEMRIVLKPEMIRSSSELADFAGLADEQNAIGDPPKNKATNGWRIPSQHWKKFPYSATIDLGQSRNLSALWIFDTNGEGEFDITSGQPDQWRTVTNYGCRQYLRWARVPLEVTTRYLRIELKSPGANFAEIALYEFTPGAHRAMLARKEAEAKERAARDAAMKQAQEELARRPWLELPPFGRVQLVDEVDCGAAEPGHQFRESPAGASRVETILGRPCRVMRPVEGEASYMAFRIGKWKRLKPGAAYVLAVDYPEDAPRSVIVMNGGNETSRGFHTGTTLGDALHSKYVREFNANFLALPALPSERLTDACDDKEVVVRAIRTPAHGTYFAVVNTGFGSKHRATVRLPVQGEVQEAISGKRLTTQDGTASVDLYPFQLRTWVIVSK